MTRSRGNGEENVTTVRRDEKWKDDKDLIFCREDGQPLCTRVFTRLTCSFVPLIFEQYPLACSRRGESSASSPGR